MLPGDNVIVLEAERRQPVGQVAVFTPPSGPAAEGLTQGRRVHLRLRRLAQFTQGPRSHQVQEAPHTQVCIQFAVFRVGDLARAVALQQLVNPVEVASR